ncbi:MAG TPA: bifunctional 5,10-methylenetetrahydrofolate dehydrogenase/5,10-methenyltetrahydrofolate cyclohydrolase [Phycisphaerae bacterium]|nr:bifunctional 5,10-methylenetetrahydrofolate dehydrogenase/5,10-methenyltetrahydrofolate cyclohydrolase [Phycisphaerae bacterium]
MSGARLMLGRDPAQRLITAARERAGRLRRDKGISPRLANVLIGDDPPSAVYVRMEQRRCREAGIDSVLHALPGDSPGDRVIERVRALAADRTVHAILVQHPVPAPIDKRAVFEAIPPEKDIDGVSSATLGRVLLGMPAWSPCTPRGIMLLLAEYDVTPDGAHAVVIGRSPILGRPMASLLINAHATVTLCHSRTRDLPDIVRQADLLIAAAGRPRFVQGDWIKPGAVVVDAGYNEGPVGDVDFESACRRAALITPVPGGVGPMTIAVLIDQTAAAAEMQLGVSTGAAAAAPPAPII